MVVYTLEQSWEVGLRSTCRRCRFCKKEIIFSDEAHFDLARYVNKSTIDLQKMPLLAKKKIIFSDEPHFDFGGYVNKQNCRIWGTKNPHACIEKPTHPKRVTVCCGFWSRGIIGPFLFQNEQFSQWRSLSGHVEPIFVYKN